MIFFATNASNQADLVQDEALKAGASEVKPTNTGVEFIGELETGYRFCLESRIASRLLLALYYDDDVQSPDELYDSTFAIPWEDWITPDKTFLITETVKNCPWLRNAHYATLRAKDAIVDRIREKFEGNRPTIDEEDPTFTFHLHINENQMIWYVDFSGPRLYERGYRSEQSDAIMKENLAAAVLKRSEWYKSVVAGNAAPLIDPFCGSGTLAIEAALMAADIAPGLVRKKGYAFERMPSFDAALFEKVKNEEIDKANASADKEIYISSWDISRTNVEISKAAALKAGVYDLIAFETKDFTAITAEDVPYKNGYIVTDPPYGIRLKEGNLAQLYSQIGQTLSTLFQGWKVALLCGDSELLSFIDLKPDRTNSIFNGPIPCQIAHYNIYTEEERQALIERAKERKALRLSTPLSDGAQMAYNRLIKNIAEISPIMKKEGVTCYRIYDADMIEYNAAIDLYEGKWVNLQEYAPPATIDPEDAERRLQELVLATERATGIDMDRIYVKQRKEQKGKAQYNRLASSNKFFVCNENGLKFLANFTDYLDTGIFLDHRPVRQMIQDMSKGKRFLNLFCYTATATINAIKGGALSTVSVDTSATYLDWAAQNLKINGYSTDIGNFFYRSDAISFLHETYDRYDLIFCDPPTFSNSKGRDFFDLQEDHIHLINACMMHLDKAGTLIFSNNYRKFQLAPVIYDRFIVEDISDKTIGDDFSRDMKIHQCYLIKHRVVVEIPKKRTIKVISKKVTDTPEQTPEIG